MILKYHSVDRQRKSAWYAFDKSFQWSFWMKKIIIWLLQRNNSVSPADREKYRPRSSPEMENDNKRRKEDKLTHVSSYIHKSELYPIYWQHNTIVRKMMSAPEWWAASIKSRKLFISCLIEHNLNFLSFWYENHTRQYSLKTLERFSWTQILSFWSLWHNI